MRKIEQQMCAAIQADKNWSSGNTQVVTNDGVSTVYLHGNKIAMVDDTTMTIFDGGWQSNTTKSRLNALCQEFCIAGEGVFQKDFLWYVRKFVGCVNGQNVYKTEDFESGYIFAWYIHTYNCPFGGIFFCAMRTIPTHCNDHLLPWFCWIMLKKVYKMTSSSYN